jgi:hypothetical protein
MSRSFSRAFISSVAVCLALLFAFAALPAWGQTEATGAVGVTVLDPSGASVAGSGLALRNLDTNSVINGTTATGGLYTFASVPFGTYELTITKAGFETQVLNSVIVQAGRVTDITVTLKIGAATEKVVVTASATPLLQTSSNSIATTIDMKQINDLPLGGRDVSQLVFLTPGYTGTAGYGTWNGLPLIAQSNTVDGVVANTNRMKFGGDATPAMSARLEDIQEMTIQTSQTSLNQGFGEASMGASYLTKGGTNSYHGEVFEDFRNSYLNANSWYNNAVGLPRNPLILNEFGGSAGGPIKKNKLFFFGSFSMSRQPGGYTNTQTFLSPTAQTGTYTVWQPQPAGSPFTVGQSINLFSQVATPNGLPATINNPAAPAACAAGEVPCPNNTYGNIANELALVNKDLTATNANITPNPGGDPNIETVNWFVPSPDKYYYPAMRLDYNATQNFRINFAFEETRETHEDTSAPYYPGPDFSNQAASFAQKNYTSSLGLGWTISPTLVNEFRVGYLYTWLSYGAGAQPVWDNEPAVNWALGNSGQEFNLATGQYYPTISGSDTLTWLHGSHTLSFGFDYAREQDHYYNAPDGIPSISLGLVTGDTAFNDFQNSFAGGNTSDRSEAERLYATLVGRISSVGPIGSGFPYNPATHEYANTPGTTVNLDELQRSWGLFAHDSYRFKPTLTLNFGLRWDFIGDDHDLAHQYLGTPLDSVWGPSGVNNIFNPGVEIGTNNPAYVAAGHQYGAWDVTPQPTIGVAWNPSYSEGILGKLFGDSGKTVVRAGFDLKRFTEPNQYFWNFATNHGIGYFQYFSLQAANGGGTGTFTPGSLSLGTLVGPNTGSAYNEAPPFYSGVVPQSEFAWNYYWGEAGFDPNIKQPYVQEWNLGIQRELGHSNVLEVRYIGSRSVHQWLAVDPNEVNIFENGFLNEFQAAQTNMAINATHGITSFANNGYAGQQALPIFDTAFAGEASGGTGVPLADYANPTFITDLQQGGAGDLAYNLSSPFGTVPYICNLVGSSVTPCANGAYGSFTAPGKYPANFFQANPYGASCLYCSQQEFMTNGGYSMYEALQVDLRQKQWHGMQFDANYTWSHTLGVQPDEQWLGTFNEFTMRDLRLSYGPTLFDLRQVLHASGTYDLPFGSGKMFLNQSGWVDKVVGGWTLGTIFSYETGFPFALSGGYRTYNDYADGGVVLNGVTLSQLQSGVGVYHPSASQYPGLPLGPYAYTINPKLLVAAQPSGYSTPANCTTGLVGVCQNMTPGTLTGDPYLYGPHLWNADLSITKVVPIRENLRFVMQGEFLNAFNHPEWGNPNGANTFGGDNIQDGSGFGQAGTGGFAGPRQIEIRARLDF